jgi:uncharacterized damage-inducible protein DinB
MTEDKLPEPWLRGTLAEVPAVLRAVVHALELAGEDLDRGCSALTDEELNAHPLGLPSVAFHLQHIAGSVDRLLTYAEGRALTEAQLAAIRPELEGAATRTAVLSELHAALTQSAMRIRGFDPSELEHPRSVGKKLLPTTVAGLLVHVADHTQRHVGQALTTAKIVRAAASARG